MNILDKIAAVIGIPGIKKGFMPAKSDQIIALFEYSGVPPDHHFDSTDYSFGVQVCVRDINPAAAYANAETAAGILNRYHDAQISVLQSSPILDIGMDGNNPPWQEYTVNFIVRRY